MVDIEHFITSLEHTPTILQNLLNYIPTDLYKLRRVENKWSIHEQVCHLVEAQTILIERFKKFETEEHPHIQSYIPDAKIPHDYYLQQNLEAALEAFPRLRSQLVTMLKGFDDSYWQKSGTHDAFTPYNTQLLLTHTLNVDHVHLFSIEQLGLTKPGLEAEIMTLP